MLIRSALFSTATLVTAMAVLVPDGAQAGGMSHVGTYGGHAGNGAVAGAGPNCKQGGGSTVGYRPSTIENNISVYKPTNINTDINVYKPVSINNNINVYKPVTVNKDVNINNNIDSSKNISIYKPINITKNIDASKNINVNKNIDASKNININKNIDINKTIIINNGNSEAEATAVAQAIAEATANSSSTSSAAVNISGSFNGGNSSSSASNSSSGAFSNSSSYNNSGGFSNGGGFIPESPGFTAGGDLGNINVQVTPVAAAPQECVYQDSTVVKAIHATCVAADGHEFPASHMLADTWINSGYEGEVARCLPGSTLKVVVGKVVQSSEGMASSYSSGQVLRCAPHEALRHYKGGSLKCATAVPVPDCTERTNLRKYGLGDMFFTYRAKVCLQTHQEFSEANFSREDASEQSTY